MTAVSQSYPNYLGGLNEQPDEQKKPGQLVEALNVIPDPTIGLTRRPGFEQLAELSGVDPGGTWFELELSNQVNADYIYFGCINPNGDVHIFNQDGASQKVRYTDDPVKPHKTYEFENDTLHVKDEDGKEVGTISVSPSNMLSYLRHNPDKPLKHCISKSHTIFTNPTTVPTLDGIANDAGPIDQNRYYSFINLKVVDLENYNYTFKRFYQDENKETYKYITNISCESVEDLGDQYDEDLTLPLQTEGPFEYSDDDPNRTPARVRITFRGQVIQIKSDKGDGYRNEARYTWNVEIIDPGKGYDVGDVFTIIDTPVQGLPQLTMKFRVTGVQQVTATAHDPIVPDLTDATTATEILAELRTKFLEASIDKAIVVGNGLYLENQVEFSVSTSEIAVADVINSQKFDDDLIPIARVNTVSELPIECYPGFIVQVQNSFDEKNDYYLKFTSESVTPDDVELTKSDGFWEEVAKPYQQVAPNPVSLPHMITVVRDSTSDEFVFIASPIAFKERTAGTSLDNPSMFIDVAPITAVNYYKNRLFFFTNVGTVISTRAGEIDNMFLETAVNVGVADPIDVVANSNQRVPIHDSIVVNNAMVLFGESEQYSLSTSNDVLSSETINVTKISNYTYDRVGAPVYVGTNIGFVGAGLSRFYEMTNIYERGPVDINERSQQVQTRFGQGFNSPVSSREQSSVFVYKQYVNEQDNRDIMLYRFRQENSQESSQTAWVRWRVDKPVAYISLPQDKLFVIVADNSGTFLYKMDASVLEGLPAKPGSVAVIPNYMDGFNDSKEGTKFSTRITFPTIYARNQTGSDITANLTIHRVKLSTAAVGAYNVAITRKGYDDYNILVEQTPSDEYRSEFPPLYGSNIETVPVYTRNKNLGITIHTDYNAPLTLQSMTWEGDWNRPYYKSV